jgi:hypothetical protein
MRARKSLKNDGCHVLTVRLTLEEFEILKLIQSKRRRSEHRKVSYTELVITGIRMQQAQARA